MSSQNVGYQQSQGTADSQIERRKRVASFFQERRKASGLSAEQVASVLAFPSAELLLKYESGIESIPMDEIFALTNVLNIPPEDVMGLIYDVYNQGQF